MLGRVGDVRWRGWKEGKEKGKGGGRGLKECRWSCRCGAVRCSSSVVLASGVRHPEVIEKTHRGAACCWRACLLACLIACLLAAPAWHGAVQCGAVHHLPVPAPRRANGRGVLRRAALLISAGVLDGVVEGREIPGGVWFGGALWKASWWGRPSSPMRGPASESQPASNPACFAMLTLGRPAKVLQ